MKRMPMRPARKPKLQGKEIRKNPPQKRKKTLRVLPLASSAPKSHPEFRHDSGASEIHPERSNLSERPSLLKHMRDKSERPSPLKHMRDKVLPQALQMASDIASKFNVDDKMKYFESLKRQLEKKTSKYFPKNLCRYSQYLPRSLQPTNIFSIPKRVLDRARKFIAKE